jgi:putative transposase
MFCYINLIMRFPRVKAQGQGFYHVISRIVAGVFVFGTAGLRRVASEKFRSMMGRQAAFSGVQILDYSLMSNHFHLVCFVPEARPLSVDEVLERIGALYGPERVEKLRTLQTRLAELPDGLELFDRLLDPYRHRMNDLSIFIKELKGCFAQWYNRKHNRYGALWAERFKSVLLEGGQALAAVVAYVSLNPVRAGLCKDPKDYPYCGYAEAVAKGTPETFEGIRIVLGLPPEMSVEQISREYRKLLFRRGALGSKNKAPVFDLANPQEVVEQEEGELSIQEQLRCKIRYFTDGVILGSRSFVEDHCQRLKQKLGYRRKSGPTACKLLGPATLWVFRNLRVRVFG